MREGKRTNAPVLKTERMGVLGRNSAAFKHESRRLNPREKHPVDGVDWQKIGKRRRYIGGAIFVPESPAAGFPWEFHARINPANYLGSGSTATKRPARPR